MSNFKQVIFIIIIISIIVILDIILANNTNSKIYKMEDILKEVEASIEEEEISKDKVYKFVDEWKKIEKVVYCYIDHEEIEKISLKVNLLKKQIEIQEYADAQESLAEVKFWLEHIRNKQTLNIENFF